MSGWYPVPSHNQSNAHPATPIYTRLLVHISWFICKEPLVLPIHCVKGRSILIQRLQQWSIYNEVYGWWLLAIKWVVDLLIYMSLGIWPKCATFMVSSITCMTVPLTLFWGVWSTTSLLVSPRDTWCSSAFINILVWVCSIMFWGLCLCYTMLY